LDFTDARWAKEVEWEKKTGRRRRGQGHELSPAWCSDVWLGNIFQRCGREPQKRQKAGPGACPPACSLATTGDEAESGLQGQAARDTDKMWGVGDGPQWVALPTKKQTGLGGMVLGRVNREERPSSAPWAVAVLQHLRRRPHLLGSSAAMLGPLGCTATGTD